MDRFENMGSFVRVVEAGSISGAADSAGVAKSVVSRRLKELEDHLGVELFHRTTRRMNLTQTGRAYYQQCVRILADVMEAESATSQAHGTLRGHLKIALPSTFGLMHMGPAIGDFLLEHPEIDLELDFNDRVIDLMQEGFDLAIRIGKLEDSSLIARRLAPIKFILCAAPSYLELFGTPKTVTDLKKHRCLMYSLVHDGECWAFQTVDGKIEKIKIRPYLKASSGEFLRSAAVKGLGLTLQPSFIAHKEIAQGCLVPLQLEGYGLLESNAYAIYPHTRHLSQRVRALVDFLIDRFNDIPYWDSCVANNKR